MRIQLIWRRALLIAALLTLVLALAPGMSRSVVRATATATTCTSFGAIPSSVAPGGIVQVVGSGCNSNYSIGLQGQVTLTVSKAGLPPSTLVSQAVVTSTDVYGNFTLSYPVQVPVTAAIGSTYDVIVSVTYNGLSTGLAPLHATFTVGSSSGASIAVNPASLLPGSPFTVTGSGFSGAGYSVNIQFGSLAVGQITVPELSGGTFTSPTNPSLYVPVTALTGAYPIVATENYVPVGGVAKTASATLYVTGGAGSGTTSSALTMNPLSTPMTIYLTPGSTVTVTGINFSGIGNVQLSSPSLAVSQVLSDPTFTTTFVVPSTTAYGTYTITAGDAYRNTYATIIVQASTATTGVTLTNTPSMVAPGQSILLTGTGYTPGSGVTISGLNTSLTSTVGTDGSINTTITVPSNQPLGTVTLYVQDSYGRAASATETIAASSGSLSASPNAAAAGATITVSGAGYQAGETVTVGLATTSATTTSIAGTTASYAANSAGAFSGTYTVPIQPIGSYLLLASGNTSRIQATTLFAINAVAATATSTPVPTATAGPILLPTPIASSTPAVGPLAAVPSGPITSYFAEGYTGTAAVDKRATFSESLDLFNPGTSPSAVTTTYFVYDPTKGNFLKTVVEHDTVAPATTIVRSVNTDVGNDLYVSIQVQATIGISAEIVISRVATDGTVLDSDSSRGSGALGQTWYLAEGYTGASLQEYVTLFNPGSVAATATMQYMPSDASAPAPQTVQVPAQGRVTINVRSVYNTLVKHGSRNVGIKVTSTQPIVVDRSMYWGDGSGSGKYGYSIGPAIGAGATVQYFPNLPLANASESYVTVLNPNTGASAVTLSLRSAFGGSLGGLSAVIPAGERYTFSLPKLVSAKNGTLIGVLTSALPVVAEAGLYYNGSPNSGRHPGLVLQGSPGATTGTRVSVNVSGAELRIMNTSYGLVRVQVIVSGAGAASVLFDGVLTSRATKSVLVPAGSSPRSIAVVSSGTYVATLINGGDGSSTAWGGNLN